MRGKVFNEEWILDGATHERIKYKIITELGRLDRVVTKGTIGEMLKVVGELGDLLIHTGIRYGEVAHDDPTRPVKQSKMEKGKRYLIVYKTAPNRKPRNCVLEFLDEDETHYWLNARPVAGTQSIPKSWVMNIREVSKLVEIRP